MRHTVQCKVHEQDKKRVYYILKPVQIKLEKR